MPLSTSSVEHFRFLRRQRCRRCLFLREIMRYSNSYGNSHNLSHHILFSGFSRSLDSCLLFFSPLALFLGGIFARSRSLFTFRFPFAFVAIHQFGSLPSFFLYGFDSPSFAKFNVVLASSVRCFHRHIYMNMSMDVVDTAYVCWLMVGKMRLTAPRAPYKIPVIRHFLFVAVRRQKNGENRKVSRFWSFGGKQKARAHQALRETLEWKSYTRLAHTHTHKQAEDAFREMVRLWDRGRRNTRAGAVVVLRCDEERWMRGVGAEKCHGKRKHFMEMLIVKVFFFSFSSSLAFLSFFSSRCSCSRFRFRFFSCALFVSCFDAI